MTPIPVKSRNARCRVSNGANLQNSVSGSAPFESRRTFARPVVPECRSTTSTDRTSAPSTSLNHAGVSSLTSTGIVTGGDDRARANAQVSGDWPGPSRSFGPGVSKVGVMGAQRTTFDKLQRDRAKKAKQAAKRERRQEKAADTGTDGEAEIVLPDGDGPLTAAELMQQVEAITRRLEAGTITLED